MIKCWRPSALNRLILGLKPRCIASDQSNGNRDVNGTSSVVDNVTDFFQKAQQNIAVEQPQQQQLNLPPDQNMKEMAVENDTDENGAERRGNENQRSQTTAQNFVPYTMGHLLQEMNIRKLPPRRSPGASESFATLFRNSPFVQLGDFKGCEVIGVVIENVNETDLYIDFGGKFHCVCQQPQNQHYPRGSLVRVRLRDPEMTNRFMINAKAITLCEADAVLLGPYRGRLVKVGQDESEVGGVYSRVPVRGDAGDATGSPTDRPATESDSVLLEHWRLL